MYQVVYAPQSLATDKPIDIQSSQYRILSLNKFNAGIVWEFAWGSCIAPQVGECEVYVSNRWDIWVDPLVREQYYGTYIWKQDHGVYQIIRDDTFVAEIHIVPQDISS